MYAVSAIPEQAAAIVPLIPRHRPWKLAVIGPSRYPLREPFAGGQESLVATLVTGLRARGHHVVLYAAAGTDPDLADEVIPHAPVPELTAISAVDPHLPEPAFLTEHHAYTQVMADLMARPGIDAVLNHSLHQLPLLLAHLVGAAAPGPQGARPPVPMVTTLHTPPFPWIELGADLGERNGAFIRYVAVSAAVAQTWSTLPHPPAVIPNGIDVSRFGFGPGGPDLAWMGRITPEKAPHLAIEVARRCGRGLRLIGPIHDRGYFDAWIAPHLDDRIRHLGHLDHTALAREVGCSAALLVTPHWDEPFGLVIAEGAACGTPVVALARGGVADVVGCGDDAIGVVAHPAGCDSTTPDTAEVDALLTVLDSAIAMDRHEVRSRALRRFSATTMSDRYEALIARLISETGQLATGAEHIEVTGIVEPSTGIQLSAQAVAVELVEPTALDRVVRAKPVELVKPVDLIESAELVEPVEPVDLVASVELVEPVELDEPLEPLEPVDLVESAVVVRPAERVERGRSSLGEAVVGALPVERATAVAPIRVQPLPASHPYPARLGTAASVVTTLPDPLVPGAPPGQWWPLPALEPAWIEEHAPEIDVIHLHFGFEHRTPAQLQHWVDTLHRHRLSLVLTVHDLQNPHLEPASAAAQAYDESLGLLIRAATRLVTLTAGAAAEIERRWGRTALVLPHPYLAPPTWLDRPRPGRTGPWTVAVHLRALRPSIDVDAVCDLAAIITRLPESRLRIHVEPHVAQPDHPRFSQRLLDLGAEPHVDLLIHEPGDDAAVATELMATDLLVLPYRSGTHSGWVELCYDLGTPVLVPDVGYLHEQRPVLVWRRDRIGDLERAVRTAHDAHLAGQRPERPGAERRFAEQRAIALAHERLYREAVEDTR